MSVHYYGALEYCCINLCVLSMKEHKFIYDCAFFVINGIFGSLLMCIKELNHKHFYFL